MTPNELTSTEQRMQQKWHDLVMAEQQGASMLVLEQMYNAYIVAVDEYNRCQSDTNSASQAAVPLVHTPLVYSEQQILPAFPVFPKLAAHVEQKRKKAS
jgi:hypothetical protein